MIHVSAYQNKPSPIFGGARRGKEGGTKGRNEPHEQDKRARLEKKI